MGDPIDAVAGDYRFDFLSVANICFQDRDPIENIGDPSSNRVSIEYKDMVLAADIKGVAREMRTQKSRSSGDKQRQKSIPLNACTLRIVITVRRNAIK